MSYTWIPLSANQEQRSLSKHRLPTHKPITGGHLPSYHPRPALTPMGMEKNKPSAWTSPFPHRTLRMEDFDTSQVNIKTNIYLRACMYIIMCA